MSDRDALHALLVALEKPAAQRLLAGFMRAHMRELHGVAIDMGTLVERLNAMAKRRALLDPLLDASEPC